MSVYNSPNDAGQGWTGFGMGGFRRGCFSA